jgi:hypothetical protein
MNYLDLEEHERQLYVDTLFGGPKGPILFPHEWHRLVMVDTEDTPILMERKLVIHVLEAAGLMTMGREIATAKLTNSELLMLNDGRLGVVNMGRKPRAGRAP